MPTHRTLHFPLPAEVHLDGPLGRALAANHAGRLGRFVHDETSPAIALFARERAATNHEGDWYGEHAGKWLQAAARAAARTGDPRLAASVKRVADFLVGVQEPDGYLGTYAPERRFTRPAGPPTRSWDGAPAQRTWDAWTHAYLVLGLLETFRHFPDARYLRAARRIGDLCWHALTTGGLDVTHLGNHFGLSATVLMDPAVELFFATREQRYLDLALRVLAQADARPELRLLTRLLEGADAAEIGTGKAYQLCWNVVGLAKLHRATGEARYLEAARHFWRNVRDHHLTLGGGPWGGVAHRSREVFNPAGTFDPEAYVETCSTFAWLQLNRELYAIEGEAAYVAEIERAAYNDLLGAQAADGEDWCYYSFPNGRRVHTTYWRCCKSSGALALEELPTVAWAVRGDRDPVVGVLGPGRAELRTAQGVVRLELQTRYPFDGELRLRVEPGRAADFAVWLRVPEWAGGAQGRVVPAGGHADAVAPDATTPAPEPGGFLRIERRWRDGDEVVLRLPMPPTLHARTSRSVQESMAPDGTPVVQEVMRRDYVAVTRGPLVYATGPVDGYATAATVRLPPGAAPLEDVPAAGAADAAPDPEYPRVRLQLRDRAPLGFVPYYAAGERADGAWRLTWLRVADAGRGDAGDVTTAFVNADDGGAAEGARR